MEQNLELALKAVFIDDEGNIFVEPFCKFFVINFKNQKRTINDDPILQTEGTKKYHELYFGDKRSRLCLRKRGFIRWIQLINAEIVHPQLQILFVQYQVAVFDYLYNGNEQKTAQLEDIRTFALNINKAVRINRQLMEYIAEQKQHRDLCLSSSPSDWIEIKANLFQEKQLPEAPVQLKAIGVELPNDIEQLRNMKKNIQTNLIKNKNRMLYNSKYKKEIENPMPEGYKKEMAKLRIKKFEQQLEEVNQKLIEITNG